MHFIKLNVALAIHSIDFAAAVPSLNMSDTQVYTNNYTLLLHVQG
jgi:hypothetical protein